MSFMSLKKYSFAFSLLLILAGLISMFTNGLNYGIDFTGGTLAHIDIGQPFTIEEVREEVLAPLGLQSATLQRVGIEGIDEGQRQEILVRTHALTAAEQDEMFAAFAERFDLNREDDLLRMENVDATIGGELQRQAFLALLIAGAAMVIYITIRFEFRFAVTAIIALLHDALIVVAFFSILQIELNSYFIAAILIIVGYSINDTIVIFDRIRENLKTQHKETLPDLVDKSLHQSLRRSINTSATTLVVLLAIFAFGGVTLRPFMSALLVGVVIGTYSSLFIASPLWVSWKEATLRKHKTA